MNCASGEYWAAVPMAAGPFSAPPTAREPSPDELDARGVSDGWWPVPLPLVLRCSSSALLGLIRARQAKGLVSDTARVILRDGRYFCTAYFRNGSDLFFALDCWALDHDGDDCARP